MCLYCECFECRKAILASFNVLKETLQGHVVTVGVSLVDLPMVVICVMSTRLLLELDCFCLANIVTEDILGHKILLPRTFLTTSKLLPSTFMATNKFNLLLQKYLATTWLLPRKL